LDDSVVSDLLTVAQVGVMEILAQLCDRLNGAIRDEPTFSQDEVPETWRNTYYPIQCGVC